MVEMKTNQRKGVIDMLAWSEGTDNGRPTRNRDFWALTLGGELFTDYSITLANLSR